MIIEDILNNRIDKRLALDLLIEEAKKPCRDFLRWAMDNSWGSCDGANEVVNLGPGEIKKAGECVHGASEASNYYIIGIGIHPISDKICYIPAVLPKYISECLIEKPENLKEHDEFKRRNK